MSRFARVAACAALIAFPRFVTAQLLQPELRFDVVGPSPIALQPGIGANARLGTYVRLGGAAGYDVRAAEGSAGRRWRGDLTARVTLDPLRQQRWALSLGGGLSYRGSRTYLAALVDLEGPEMRGLLPALQFGASGGMRGGFVLRRAIRGRR